MKKLKKLQINPERLIKNEELISLRGGYGTWCCTVNCPSYYYERNFTFSSTCPGWDNWCADNECEAFFELVYPDCDCGCSASVQC